MPAYVGDVTGTVTDSSSGQPLPGGEVSVMQGANIVVNTQTNQLGRYTVHNLSAGTYVLVVRYIGFRPEARTITLGANAATTTLNFQMVPVAINLQAVEVTAAVPIAVDTRTGDQVFKQNDYHGAPTNTTSQILQQSIVGAARAPTGEVHIRGQHAEYTYYVDGVPVPSGVSGSLNELFDPQVVNQITFQTGGWDAEFGNKNAAIVDVTTRIPAGGLHTDLGSYVGTYDTHATAGSRGFNGQSLSVSDNAGSWGFFFSGARQETQMRREPVLFDTAAQKVVNFHNYGQDLFGFGKIQYTPGAHDVANLDFSWSQTRFAVPFDSTSTIDSATGQSIPNRLNVYQRDRNAFVNLGWRHQFGVGEAEARTTVAGKTNGNVTGSAGNTNAGGAELFAGLFYRYGSLDYTPGSTDTPSFIFFPDTTPYNLREARSFNTYGLKADVTYRPREGMEFKAGTLTSFTTGHENFVTTDANGRHGPASSSGLSGHDIGVYAQTAVSPVEWFELRTGLRYDTHVAPFAGNQHQLSPRVRLNFYPGPATTVYLYYGRLFIPTNVEDLRAITSVAQQGVVTAPTLPERDNFYEAGIVHRLPYGLVAKLSGYYKQSTPGIDDNTIPGSAIVTSVNISRVRITGIEGILEVRPSGPVSGYFNVALNHAYAHGPITGGFFPAATPPGYFDLDHDQRLSGVATLTYSPSNLFLSATGIYGSGLTNGISPDACGCSYGTGLLDFNRGIKVRPSFIMNASAGYTIVAGRSVLRPQLYVENLFDKTYALKGAFFSGASVGRPRSVQFRVNVGF